MKQKKFDTLTSILIYLLFALTVLYPFGFAASSLLGYTFKLTNAAVYSCVIAILSICTMMLTISLKEGLKSKPARALITYMPLLSMINAILLIFDLEGFIAIGGALISAVCCFAMALICGRPLVLKIISLTLSVLLLFPAIYLGFYITIFGNMWANTVVKAVESPSGEYCAKVIDNGQGALGGNTFVDVYKGRELNFIIFTIEKKPERVYEGDWGYGEHMDIYWKDDKCLIIDSKEHVME